MSHCKPESGLSAAEIVGSIRKIVAAYKTARSHDFDLIADAFDLLAAQIEDDEDDRIKYGRFPSWQPGRRVSSE
jgi:hypothetical protein